MATHSTGGEAAAGSPKCPSSPVSHSEFLTVDQTAALLQVSVQTVYDYSSRGRLTFCKVRFGRHIRFQRQKLIDKLEKGGF